MCRGCGCSVGRSVNRAVVTWRRFFIAKLRAWPRGMLQVVQHDSIHTVRHSSTRIRGFADVDVNAVEASSMSSAEQHDEVLDRDSSTKTEGQPLAETRVSKRS